MADNIDLNEFYRLFLARGERVVVVMPGHEPIVLLPLSQYESLADNLPATAHRQPKLRPTKNETASKPTHPAVQSLEAVDPLQGQLPGDDQYFPEPLEPEL